jgi:hypothetical protein
MLALIAGTGVVSAHAPAGGAARPAGLGCCPDTALGGQDDRGSVDHGCSRTRVAAGGAGAAVRLVGTHFRADNHLRPGPGAQVFDDGNESMQNWQDPAEDGDVPAAH